MSKVICDVCGTSYSETSVQCPICGCARTDAARTIPGEAGKSDSRSYEYVKGGRFSQTNVRRRNNGKQELPRSSAPSRSSRRAPEPEPEEEVRSNVGLIIVVVILLLAIIAVCAYIGIRFMDLNNDRNNASTAPSGSSSLEPSKSEPVFIPCQDVILTRSELTFLQPNSSELLSVSVLPENTTDEIKVYSNDESVVRVVKKGNNWEITPVVNGQAVIYVECGAVKKIISVTCTIGIEPSTSGQTEPSAPTEPPAPTIELKLNRYPDTTLRGYGSAHNLARTDWGGEYSGPEDRSEITWTSSNEAVATVVNGVVTAVGNGTARITAEWQGQVASCLVICWDVKPPVETGHKISHTDVSLYIGGNDQFTLSLLVKEDSSKVPAADLVYTVKDETICSVDENGRVKALATGTTTITIEYDGHSYECIVRVHEA